MTRQSRRLRFLHLGLGLAAAICAALAPAASVSADDQNLEYAVKAAYLYKFGAFVEWPAGSFAASNSPAQICVIGNDPFGDALDKAIEGKAIGDHPATVRRLKTATRDAGCHILFVGGSESAQSVAQTVELTKGTPTLTVTDTTVTGGRGEVIHFVMSDNRIRFEIDDKAAAGNGLTISSKLLSIAAAVKTRE